MDTKFIPFLLVALLFYSPFVTAKSNSQPVAITSQQELDEALSDTSNWEYDWRISLNGTQSSYRNWSQGGVDNISILGTTGFSAKYRKNIYIYDLNINLGYGKTRIGDGDFIKSEDIIRIRNQARRLFQDERFSAIFNVNLETQFDEGYDSEDQSLLISRFFAPAYLSEVLGLSYNPDEYLRFEGGLAMKQTFVRDTELSTRYGLPEGETFRNEVGLSFLIGYERRIMENIYYAGYVETFSNVNKNLRSTDVFFTNEINGRINRFISANIEFALAYNDDVIDELQIKQIVSIGLNYSFFE